MVVRKDDLQMKILLVEDDKTIASGLEYSAAARSLFYRSLL